MPFSPALENRPNSPTGLSQNFILLDPRFCVCDQKVRAHTCDRREDTLPLARAHLRILNVSAVTESPNPENYFRNTQVTEQLVSWTPVSVAKKPFRYLAAFLSVAETFGGGARRLCFVPRSLCDVMHL